MVVVGGGGGEGEGTPNSLLFHDQQQFYMNMLVRVCMEVMSARVLVCVCVCVRACVRVSVRACMCVTMHSRGSIVHFYTRTELRTTLSWYSLPI